MFYIYAYINPNTNLPFYIGKGTGSRKHDHLNQASSKKENRDKWETICLLNEAGTPPIIKVLEDNITNEALAYNREDYYILSYGRKGFEENGILTNKTIGGKHPPKPKWTPADRERHSKFNNEYWTAERRALHCTDTVAVTDLQGKSKRISKSLYNSIDKTAPLNTLEYVSVSSKESKRRKQQNTP